VLRRIGLTIKEGEFVTVMVRQARVSHRFSTCWRCWMDGWLGEYWFGETACTS